MKAFSAIGLLVAGFALSTFPITITVSKTGSADKKTIGSAIDAAQAGDVVMVLDSSTYNEQVTISGDKAPLTLTAKNPASRNKPKILWQDKLNVGPRTYAESQVDSLINFDKNGALRIIKAKKVVIDGIAVDGGGAYPFGYPSVYEGRYGLQSGNAAIVLFQSGDIVIRNCDISNAYFGVYMKDRNPGGIYAQQNPTDLDTNPVVPLSGFGLTGNHLFEYNRIHHNSWGMFFESLWDLGSTIRYNLVFENHHATDSLAAKVKSLTSDEGANQPGGAMLLKDVPLCPLAIYNNTFWHNFALFSGHWQAGYQHLVFNNIFGTPNNYWSTGAPQFNTATMELSTMLLNRINHCVYSAQAAPPQSTYVRIMDAMAQLQGTESTAPEPGTLIASTVAGTAFPSSANVRWLEMDTARFLSVDPLSADFLEPKWSDTAVQKFIAQNGWQASGVKNTDDSWADLGAIERAHGRSASVGTINPAMPIIMNGAQAAIQFTLDERAGSTLTEPVITFFRIIRNQFARNTFGSNDKTFIITSGNITDLALPSVPPVKIGPNSYSVSVPSISGDYAFIEMFIEAKDSNGKPFTAAAGFLPYRKLDYKFSIEILDTTMTQTLTSVPVGEPVILRLAAKMTNNELFTQPINPVSVTLLSGYTLLTPGTPPAELVYPSGITGVDNKKVIFTKIPNGSIEYLAAAGRYKNPSTGSFLPFLGGANVKVLSGPPENVVFVAPPSNSRKLAPPSLPVGAAYACTLLVLDKYGNICNTTGSVKISNCCSSSPAKIIYSSSDSVFKADSNGVISFLIQPAEDAKLGDFAGLVAKVTGTSGTDSAGMVVGPHVSVLMSPTPHSRLALSPNQDAVVSVFDLQGRRIFHRTITTREALFSPAYFVRGFHAGLSSKAYVVETIITDKLTMKQSRNIRKIMVR